MMGGSRTYIPTWMGPHCLLATVPWVPTWHLGVKKTCSRGRHREQEQNNHHHHHHHIIHHAKKQDSEACVGSRNLMATPLHSTAVTTVTECFRFRCIIHRK
ncbi:hypothetical protein KC19_7G153700 [Ceratodon purpureus]|uniref:Uncharacterized protein n=1 Tax=Ceratodon purpureus TaxID=3225 RepID=A0A8T0HAI0_CERPU|nr:hypothetical protein KC19_7G153700 [Ceratodon purpureus]